MRDDTLFAVPFQKEGKVHQRVLFALDPEGVLWQDPATKILVKLGEWHGHGDIIIASFCIEGDTSRF